MELRKNGIYRVSCTGYTSQGVGIARIEGRVIFVEGLIRDEVADIKILKVGHNAVYAKVENLITASVHRLEPDCMVYGKCGGCALRHMDYEEELYFKRSRVDDALKRIGGLELSVCEIYGAPDVNGYRNKTIYTVGMEGSRAVTGFYRARTHELVPAGDCLIESDYSKRAAGALREAMDRFSIPAFTGSGDGGIRRLMCRYGFYSGEGQLVLVTDTGRIKGEERLLKTLLKACPETVSIMRNINTSMGDTVMSGKFTNLWGRGEIEDTLCSLSFKLSPNAFYQVNRTQAELLYSKALELAELTGEESVLDLYCGTGTITLCLAKAAKHVIGAEIVESAVINARENAQRNGILNAEFICSDAGESAKRLLENGFVPDVIVVDPPRKGLLTGVPEIIASMGPKRVIYVSCDPGTLARDLKIFRTLGYEAEKAYAVDMFPRTYHVETVCLLSKLRTACRN